MKAIVIGYSGHAFVVLDTLLSLHYQVIGYCEQHEKMYNPFQLNYFGYEAAIDVLDRLKNAHVFLGIGDNKVRAKVYNYLVGNNINCPNAVHPKACVSASVTLGSGTLIMPGVIINAMATVGRAVVCNTASVIEHECQLGDFVHIAPGAVLAGNVSIGEASFVGANAVIKQGVTIGKNVIIGAGTVVTKDIEDGLVVYGNPAKKK